MKKNSWKTLFCVIFAVFISIPIILPYFHKGFFPTHDGQWAVVRAGDMFRQLKDLQIPPRYSGNLNFGYGYPLFNFAYPFPYYLATLLHIFHIGFVSSVKILFALSVPLSAISMFLLAKELWKNTASAVISSILYVYLPYRLVDLYARGSLGESISFVLFPLLFYVSLKMTRSQNPLFFTSLGAILLGILITTHNIMAILFLPVLIVFIFIIYTCARKSFLPYVLSLFLGLGASAFFWLPALLEKQYIILSKIPIADRNLYFVKPLQLIIPRFGYGLPTSADGFSYQIGIPHLLFFFVVLALLIIHYKKRKKTNQELFIFAFALSAVTCVMTLLLFSPTNIIWKNMPLLSEINYPWTLLAVIGFLISLLSGFLATLGKKFVYISFFIAGLAIVLVFPYAKPQYYVNNPDTYYLTNDATTTSSSEYMPAWVGTNPTSRNNQKVVITDGSATLENIRYNSKNVSFSGNFQSNASARINTIYYPGWKVFVDGKEAAVSYLDSNGLMDFPISSGSHQVVARLSETPLRLFSDFVSLATVVLLLFFLSLRPLSVFMTHKKK